MDTESLKPCPFCGGSVRFDTAYSYFRDSVIYCDNCDMIFTLDDCSTTDAEICGAWNQRAEQKSGNRTPTEAQLDEADIVVIGDTDPVNPAFWVVSSDGFITCSACGEENGETSAFCPHCGKPMDGGADNV